MAETGASRPRLLIEDWLPAAAIGIECMRERSTGQQPPDKRFHGGLLRQVGQLFSRACFQRIFRVSASND
jgi:hypothetical protein